MTPSSSCPAMSGDIPALLLSILRELKKISTRLESLELIAREQEGQLWRGERDDVPPPPSMIAERHREKIEGYEEGLIL